MDKVAQCHRNLYAAMKYLEHDINNSERQRTGGTDTVACKMIESALDDLHKLRGRLMQFN